MSGGHLDVVMGDQGNGKYRADLKFEAGTNYTINSTTDRIMAVKFIGDKPATGSFKMELRNDTDGNWINNGGSRYNSAGSTTTTAGNMIYYFDFSGDTNYTVGDKEINKIFFVIADVVDPTDYIVDWVASFADLEAYKDTKDDGPTDTEGTILGVNDVIVEASRIKIFPNPSADNMFNIKFNGSLEGVTSLKIYNILGGLVLEKKISGNSKNMIINHNLKTGIHLVKVGSKRQTLIVE